MCNWGRVRFAHPPGLKPGRLHLRATRFFVRKMGVFSPCARRGRGFSYRFWVFDSRRGNLGGRRQVKRVEKTPVSSLSKNGYEKPRPLRHTGVRRSRTAEESHKKAHVALCKRRFMAWRRLMARRLLLHSADEARLADASGNALAEQGDVFGGDAACEGKAQGAACRRGIDAHRGEDVRWFGGAG